MFERLWTILIVFLLAYSTIYIGVWHIEINRRLTAIEQRIERFDDQLHADAIQLRDSTPVRASVPVFTRQEVERFGKTIRSLDGSTTTYFCPSVPYCVYE